MEFSSCGFTFPARIAKTSGNVSNYLICMYMYFLCLQPGIHCTHIMYVLSQNFKPNESCQPETASLLCIDMTKTLIGLEKIYLNYKPDGDFIC